MKKSLIGFVAMSALFAAPAIAADMGLPVKAPLAPAPAVYSWTGCYLNAGGGFGMWKQDHFSNTVPPAPPVSPTTVTTSDGGSGGLGVVGGGCDYQISPSFVVGALADYDFMSLTGTNHPAGIFFPPGFQFFSNAKEKWAWAVGGRIGYLVNPTVLVYLNGGYTQTRFDFSPFSIAEIVAIPGPFGTLEATTFHGGFIGGGTEINLGWLPGLYLRAEYRFAAYSGADVREIFAGAPTGFAENIKPFVQTVTGSLVYRFNWWGGR